MYVCIHIHICSILNKGSHHQIMWHSCMYVCVYVCMHVCYGWWWWGCRGGMCPSVLAGRYVTREGCHHQILEHSCMYVCYVCVYVYIYVCVYIYTYMHTRRAKSVIRSHVLVVWGGVYLYMTCVCRHRISCMCIHLRRYIHVTCIHLWQIHTCIHLW